MKKTLKKLTHVTLATTLSVGPTVTPLMTYAKELDSSTTEEQLLTENETVKQTTPSFVLSDWTHTEDQDSITLKKYIGSQTSLYIPGEFDGKRVFIESPSSVFNSSLKELVIEEINGVKVGLKKASLWCAFSSKKQLISLDLSGLDTSNVTDMASAFSSTPKLTSLNLSGWDTSNVTDMSRMFSDTSLTHLDLSHFNTSKVTDMSSVFSSTPKLTSLNLSGWDTSNVTDMSHMFYETSVTHLDLSHFNTSKVTDMRWMFQRAYRLTTLEISDWDTSSVTNMSQMFAYTPKLASLDLSKWNTSNVNKMQGMFEWASALTTLDLSEWDTSKVTTMYYMFYNASGLTTLDVSGWDTSNVVSMYGMFEKTYNLTSLDLSKWDVSKAWGMERMFRDMTNLRILNLGEFKRPQLLSGLFYTDTTQPLIIMTTNDELKTYDFVSDNRTSVQFHLETNGGTFLDGTTEFTSPEFLVVENQEEVEQLLKNAETPLREGYEFVEWELTTPLSDNELEALYQRMSGTYQAKWRLPNVAPVIEAEDVTIYQGDSFNPLDYVSVTDEEDGPITLTKDNVIFNNVDVSTPGIYQVTYKVTDQEGATSSKTITVTVLKKEVVELPETDSSTDDTNNDVEKPTPPTTEKPNEPSIEKPTDKPTEKPSTPTTDHQQPNGTNQETIETGFTNFAMLFVGLFACLQGLMVWKRRK